MIMIIERSIHFQKINRYLVKGRSPVRCQIEKIIEGDVKWAMKRDITQSFVSVHMFKINGQINIIMHTQSLRNKGNCP